MLSEHLPVDRVFFPYTGSHVREAGCRPPRHSQVENVASPGMWTLLLPHKESRTDERSLGDLVSEAMPTCRGLRVANRWRHRLMSLHESPADVFPLSVPSGWGAHLSGRCLMRLMSSTKDSPLQLPHHPFYVGLGQNAALVEREWQLNLVIDNRQDAVCEVVPVTPVPMSMRVGAFGADLFKKGDIQFRFRCSISFYRGRRHAQ